MIMGSLSPKQEIHKLAYINLVMLMFNCNDAIGMGLNMDINKIYFSSLKKFDGKKTRLNNRNVSNCRSSWKVSK